MKRANHVGLFAPDAVRFRGMSGANVFINHSQFPENVRRDLLASLRARAINHKFHYDSYKQAAKWLALHEAFSPARRDASCLRIYDEAFQAATERGVHAASSFAGAGRPEFAEASGQRELKYGLSSP